MHFLNLQYLYLYINKIKHIYMAYFKLYKLKAYIKSYNIVYKEDNNG